MGELYMRTIARMCKEELLLEGKKKMTAFHCPIDLHADADTLADQLLKATPRPDYNGRIFSKRSAVQHEVLKAINTHFLGIRITDELALKYKKKADDLKWAVVGTHKAGERVSYLFSSYIIQVVADYRKN